MSELVLANKEDIVAIADAIRSKTGQTGGLALSEMAEKINSLPDAGSGGGTAVETCELTVSGSSSNYYPTNIAYMTLDSDGNIIYKNETVSTSSVTVTCLRNSIVAVKFKSTLNYLDSTISNNLLFYYSTLAVLKIGDVDSITLNNSNFTSGGGGA